MKRILLVVASMCLFAAHPSLGQVPESITYQGLLTDVDGASVADGDFSLTFRLYDSAAGGTALWEETQTVAVEGGVFSVNLGSVEPLSIDFDKPYWLGATIGSGSELAPRTELTAAGYSLNSRSVHGANIFPAEGYAGIGTLEPHAGIHVIASEASNGVAGTARIFTPAIFQITNQDNITNALTASTQGSGWAGQFLALGDASRGIRVSASSGQPALAISGGNVGIGTDTPAAKLHIAGTAGVDGIMFPDGTLQTTAATNGGGGLTLPFDGTNSENQTAFKITNTGTANGIDVNAKGTGIALLAKGQENALGIFASSSGFNSALSAYTSGTAPTGFFQLDNASSDASAVNAISNGTGAAGLFAMSGTGNGLMINHTGTSGKLAVFQSSGDDMATIDKTGRGLFQGGVAGLSINNTIPAVSGTHTGNGRAASFTISGDGFGSAVFGSTSGTGRAGDFQINNSANSQFAVFGASNGSGFGGYFQMTGTGSAGKFEINNSSSDQPALVATTDGTGAALLATKSSVGGPALLAFNLSNGEAVLARNQGTGLALLADQTGGGLNIAVFQTFGQNKARIDIDGKGFFNGGTQTGGADVAEAFEVEGLADHYEPGDVLVISTNRDRTVEKSDGPYSNLVAGVYATKPGVLLTERDIEDPQEDTVPMGVVGVIPTKVSGENGPIRRGDLLVTASIPGHAMKGTDRARMIGATIGKALENFDGTGTGIIKVLVNVK